jgi:photosystem II stability/assembly factor-like uncharacterized protein
MVVGQKGYVASSDSCGEAWTPAGTPPRDDVELSGVVHAKGVWVSVGTQYTINDVVAFHSTDGGDSWIEGTVSTPTPQAQLEAVTHGAGVWIAVGSAGTILRSTDGQQWQQVDSDTSRWLNDVVYCGGRFVAVAELGEVFVSTDGGLTWQMTPIGTQSMLIRLVCSGQRLFTLGSSPTTLLTSLDAGDTWSALATPTEDSLDALAWGGGLLVTLGDYRPSATHVYYSDDEGASWSQGVSDYNFVGVGDVVFVP